MPQKKPETVGDLLFWSYANLAMAHAAVQRGDKKYGRIHFMVRARLYKGLREGNMGLGSLVEDERLKMVLPQACTYCGGIESLAVDHLISRKRGGPETGDNIVWACQSCNSSKGASDLLEWLRSRGEFPTIYLLRRYLKLAIEWADLNSLLDHSVDQVDEELLPFAIGAIPVKYPNPTELQLWINRIDATTK